MNGQCDGGLRSNIAKDFKNLENVLHTFELSKFISHFVFSYLTKILGKRNLCFDNNKKKNKCPPLQAIFFRVDLFHGKT